MVGDSSMTEIPPMPNGSGAAAILSAGIGCFVLAVLAFAADKSTGFKNALIFYKPTGALSGDSIIAIAVWLVCWVLLEWRWRGRSVEIMGICWAAFALLCLGFLLTFPPLVDIL